MVHSVQIQRSQQMRVSLSLQSLIDVRHDVLRHRKSTHSGRSDFPGQRTGIKRGQGLEFVDLRQYDATDDVRHIDWNVTARSNQPYTRLFREEREHITTVVVDLRPLMYTGSERLRAVCAARLSACVLWQARESGDRCAAMVISTKGIMQSRPVAGTKGVLQALELISAGFAATKSFIDGKVSKRRAVNTVLSDALSLINMTRGRSGSYFFISGFDTADDKHWLDTLAITAVTNQLKAILLFDPIERGGLPTGYYQYRKRKKLVSTRINDNNSQQLVSALNQRILSKQVQFTDVNVPLLTVSTEMTCADFLSQVSRQKLL